VYERHTEETRDLVSRLIGRETGSQLTANRMVQDAEEAFQRLLLEVYMATQAFIYRYNLRDEASALTSQVYQLTTLEDVRRYIELLDRKEQQYCAKNHIGDCDYVNNREVFEFSMQKQLYPELRDIVNPATGRVLTVGEQFHNLITSFTHVKRRKTSTGVRTQIELPFSIWANDRGSAGRHAQRFMLPREDCNHIIVADRPGQSGTVAVNVLGARLGSSRTQEIKYQIWRGSTDYIRSCTEKQTEEAMAVNVFTAGWPLGDALGRMNGDPTFMTRSMDLSACKNNSRLMDVATRDSEHGCYRFFARDRSLAAPDYTIVLPYVDDEQSWIFGDGLPDNRNPVIEDIVLYFRYNAQPISPVQ
jgi:hypothetical protein